MSNSAPRQDLKALKIGEALRPIVLGRAASMSEPGIELRRPELALGATQGGVLLGYVLIDRTQPAPAWGGLTTAPGLTLDTARTLMSSAALQLGLFRIPRPAHHCLLATTADASRSAYCARLAEFLDAIRSVTDSGLCRIVYTRDNERMTPEVSQLGIAASGVGATVATLEHLGCAVDGSTLGLLSVGEPGRCAADELVRRGMRIVADDAASLRAGVDVLLVDAPVWQLNARRAQAIRARIVVHLGVLVAASAVEKNLAGRGVLLVPDTIAAAGGLVAPHLVSEGLDERAAIDRCFAQAHSITLESLDRSGGAPLSIYARASAREALRESASGPEPS